MSKLGDLVSNADFKNEKHQPVIDCPDKVKADEKFKISVMVGKEIPHPNTTEHHIRWIRLHFKPDNYKFSYHLGNYEFAVHGESVEGANQGAVYSHPDVSAVFSTKDSGTLYATSYCNIHGLWEASKRIEIG